MVSFVVLGVTSEFAKTKTVMHNNDYYVFERLPDGRVVWHGCVHSLQAALRQMLVLKTLTPDRNHEFFTEFCIGFSLSSLPRTA